MNAFAHLYEKKESFFLVVLVILGIVLGRIFSPSLVPPKVSHSLILVLAALIFFDAASLVSLKHHRTIPWQRIMQWGIVSGLGVALFYFLFYRGIEGGLLSALSAAAILAAVSYTERDATPVASILVLLIAVLAPLGASAAGLSSIMSIGTGFFIGLLVFRFMRGIHSPLFSPLVLVGAMLTTFVLAEQLGGNGLLAVTTLGVVFGTVSLKEKPAVASFMRTLAHASSLLVFVIAGLLIPVSFDAHLAGVAATFFGALLIIRYVSVIATPHHGPALARTLAPPHAAAVALLLLAPHPLVLMLVVLSNILFILAKPKPI